VGCRESNRLAVTSYQAPIPAWGRMLSRELFRFANAQGEVHTASLPTESAPSPHSKSTQPWAAAQQLLQTHNHHATTLCHCNAARVLQDVESAYGISWSHIDWLNPTIRVAANTSVPAGTTICVLNGPTPPGLRIAEEPGEAHSTLSRCTAGTALAVVGMPCSYAGTSPSDRPPLPCLAACAQPCPTGCLPGATSQPAMPAWQPPASPRCPAPRMSGPPCVAPTAQRRPRCWQRRWAGG